MTARRRPTFIGREVSAGCFVCHGSNPAVGSGHWRGGNAQALAARHHDATGHQTWCDIAMSVRYGHAAPDPRQTDIEDSIAAAGGASSGGRQPAAPLPDPAPVTRTPAVAPAGASDTQAARTRKPFTGRARGRCQPETASA